MATRGRTFASPLKPFTAAVGDHRGSAREVRLVGVEPPSALAREFDAIYRREQPVALAYARRYVDADTADDVVSAVFTSYWEGYGETPPRVFSDDAAHTQAAILAAVRNRLHTVRRRRRGREEKDRYVQAAIAPRIREWGAPDGRRAELELDETVAQALDALPRRQREVFCLVKLDERSYEEAAAALGISVHTVHQHLVKASERLRVALAEYREGPERRAYEVYDEDVVVRTIARQE